MFQNNIYGFIAP